MNLDIVFFGSSIHSLPTLKKLIQNYTVVAVVTQPDKPVGRKGIITPTPVSQYAEDNGLIVIKPQSNKDKPWEYKNPDDVTKTVLELKPDLLVVSYYGQKIPNKLIQNTTYGGLNIHPSLLPKYQGAAPSEWAIINGETETGISILTLDNGFDNGKIVYQEKDKIRNTDTPENIYKRLFEKGAELLITIIPDYIENKIDLKEQDESQVIQAPRLTKDDGKIDWKKSPQEIERKIRAFYPWPGTFTFVKINDKTLRLKILKAHQERNRLHINTVQLEGKKPVSFTIFKNAYPSYQFI